MPSGLTNSPAMFQSCMINKILSGKDWDFVFTYLDDIFIASKSFEEHITHVEAVLKRLQEAGNQRSVPFSRAKLIIWDLLCQQMEFGPIPGD